MANKIECGFAIQSNFMCYVLSNNKMYHFLQLYENETKKCLSKVAILTRQMSESAANFRIRCQNPTKHYRFSSKNPTMNISEKVDVIFRRD